jgi:hypothetical protein
MFSLLAYARMSALARFDTHGANHGDVFHPIGEEDPKRIIADHGKTLLDIPDSCSVNPYNGTHKCSSGNASSMSADGFLSDRHKVVTGW